jgi:hypothetical protein
MNNVLEICRTKRSWPRIFLEGLKVTTKNLSQEVPVEIRIGNVSYTSQKHCRLRHLALTFAVSRTELLQWRAGKLEEKEEPPLLLLRLVYFSGVCLQNKRATSAVIKAANYSVLSTHVL